MTPYYDKKNSNVGDYCFVCELPGRKTKECWQIYSVGEDAVKYITAEETPDVTGVRTSFVFSRLLFLSV